MFRGSLPAPVQSLIKEDVNKWDCKEIYVGCSGNFTIERVLTEMGGHILHGNDVTLYSAVIGSYFAGKPIKVKFNDDYEDKVGWVKEYLDTPAGTVATLMLVSRFSQYIGKSNPYYDRMIKAYREQWPELFGKTLEKLEKSPLHLESFAIKDVCEWIDEIPSDAGVICYPPFFAGDYENMFAKLEKIFTWDEIKPQYECLTKERIDVLFKKMMERKHWIFGTNDRLPDYKEYLIGMAKTTNRGVPLYMYGDCGKSRICTPNQKIEEINVPRLAPGQEIGNTMRIMILSSGQFHALRSAYMNMGIKPGAATLAMGVMVDDKLIGVFAFSAAPSHAKWDCYIEGPHIYLLSDFPVAPTDYDRLSKLVLYAALSKESQLLAERITSKRIRSITTTAFSSKPVSMKYRGLFHLLNKKERNPPGGDEQQDMSQKYYSQRFELNYGSAIGRWTLAEGLAEWKNKHGGRTEKRGNNGNPVN